MSLILLSKSPEFMTCEWLIVPNREVNILAMVQAILWVPLLMLEIMGHRGGIWFADFG